ncbi:hypothetical protein DFH07DRAFT_819695 [Mycena maculata]|uniref:Uncharacterized protein n=1 Tax=Mycena maculata TaxID=230809 RepID=A0AAD7J509_9AGAR|nr:hypothetical protein DFH07DRAFT_819695 [Mycena maculata]
MAFIIRSSVVMAGLTSVVMALPPPKARASTPSASDPDIKQSTQAVITDFLSSEGVNSTFNFLSSWTAVDFSGAEKGNMTTGHINSIMFQSFDPLTSSNGSNTWFSTEYFNFVEDVNKAVPSNQANNSQIVNASNAQAAACSPITSILNAAIPEYLSAAGISTLPTGSNTDPGLREWAQANYAPLITANLNCEDATNNYYSTVTKIMGDDVGIFSSMVSIDSWQLDPDKAGSQPGNNMPISDPLPGLPTVGTTGQYVPEYEISVLNGTLSYWQSTAAPGETPKPAWSQNVTSSTFTNDSTTKSGGGGLSFIWEDVSGSGSGSSSQTTTNITGSTSVFSMGFTGIQLMSIDRGIWFDGFRLASAAQNPPDNVTAPAKPVFDKYFGTSSNPGPAAKYKRQALIGFQPSWTVKLQSSSDYQQLKTSAGSAGGCFLFICANSASSTSSNKTTTDDSSLTITYQDTTNNAYIIGYVIASYWDHDNTTTVA